MVFFTCDVCNESLKKNQVDKHCFKCKTPSVTCIDCGVCFYDNDYAAHLVCISESEKYEKSLYKAKSKLNPQDAWMESIATAINAVDNAPKSLRLYLTRLADFANIPRNKNKFTNFLKNSLRLQSTAIVDELWDWIGKHQATTQHSVLAAPADTLSQPISAALNYADKITNDVSIEKKKKDKHENDSGTEGTVDVLGSKRSVEELLDGEDEKSGKKKKKKKDKKRKESDRELISSEI